MTYAWTISPAVVEEVRRRYLRGKRPPQGETIEERIRRTYHCAA